MTIRLANHSDIPRLFVVWERAVRGSHFFLKEKDILDIQESLTGFLPSFIENVWVFEDGKGDISGFIGLESDNMRILGRGRVEMLFVDHDSQGKGVGSALLNFAKEKYDSLELEVNEDNPDGEKFYLGQGFVFRERLPHDMAGRPFPLLRLVWTKEPHSTSN